MRVSTYVMFLNNVIVHKEAPIQNRNFEEVQSKNVICLLLLFLFLQFS
mgnify:FL=1